MWLLMMMMAEKSKFGVLVAALLLSMFVSADDVGRGDADVSKKIESAIAPLIADMAKKYNCSVSVALVGKASSDDDIVALSASGITDRSTAREASVSDSYVWGSVTKLVTGSAVLRHVDSGDISLDDPVVQYIDPFLARSAKSNPKQNFTCMKDLWGPRVSEITVRDLLGMTSGLPDFDTASPSGRQPTDSLRADVYKHPQKCYSPLTLISVPWCATGKLLFTPGVCDRQKYYNCYSSTNFIMLGFLLAELQGAADWESFDQGAYLKDVGLSPRFSADNAPSHFTPVRGYDTTHYNGNTGSIDVADCCGVFAGWTASDVVADAKTVAALAQDIFGAGNIIKNKHLVDEMYADSNLTGYGLATFNLTRLTPHDVAYGHLGATYGYQSVVAYAPRINISLSVATNIERDFQDQPADVFCSVYNTAKAIIRGEPIPKCTYTKGYWSGGCKCVYSNK